MAQSVCSMQCNNGAYSNKSPVYGMVWWSRNYIQAGQEILQNSSGNKHYATKLWARGLEQIYAKGITVAWR